MMIRNDMDWSKASAVFVRRRTALKSVVRKIKRAGYDVLVSKDKTKLLAKIGDKPLFVIRMSKKEWLEQMLVTANVDLSDLLLECVEMLNQKGEP